MAFPHPPHHLRITFSGTLGTQTPAPEVWSINLSAAGPLEGDWLQRPLADQAALAGSLAVRFGLIRQELSPVVKLTRTRVASIGDLGRTMRTAQGAFQQGDSATPLAGTGADNGLPWQSALAVTTLTDFAGATGRGRFYLPLPQALTVAADGTLADMDRDRIRTAAKAFLDGINTDLAAYQVGLRLVVASGGSLVKNLEPATHTIERIAVGRVMDTIRSRRNALNEDYERADLA